ncbi:nucleotidyltransferase domain-containing protein [Candidatus Woesearchaeota archaeon]|nr:nucleotidyltransferase domain-containing protein [Candidatus Woesearchaeota archaeon]
MGILKKQYIIDSAFIKEPWKKLTYSDIQKITKKRSKGYIYNALKRLIDERIILTEKVGKSILYSLNLSSISAQSYMGFLHEYISWNQKHIPLQIIEKIRNKIPTKFFILLLTGSYAKKNQTKTSDLDIVIICDDCFDTKKIMAQIEYESDISIPKVHPYVFTKDQFLKMLSDDGENYGKETARHSSIFYGGSQYYSILNEAIKHGFRG